MFLLKTMRDGEWITVLETDGITGDVFGFKVMTLPSKKLFCQVLLPTWMSQMVTK